MLQTERINDRDEATLAVLDGRQAQIWTTMPGIIEAVNGNGTVNVQPAIMCQVRAPNGSTVWTALPLLLDCPIVYQRGGGCTFTFPVAKNDECVVSFASRCIDAWWSAGGIQVQSEFRMHDLSDGFAFVGPFSQATLIGGISTSSAQLRSNDGSTFIDLNPSTQKVTITAPGGFTVNAPQSNFSGAVIIQGLLSWLAGMTGSVASGVASLITGAVQFVGSITSNGHAIDSTHQHTNSGGTGLGGPPQ